MTEAPTKTFVGMSRKDRARYSLQRVVRSLIDRTPITDGIEREIADEVAKGAPGKPEGFFIPNDLFLLTRDLNASTFGSGAAFVETHVDPDYIPIMRNKTLCERMGAQRLSGLSSNVAIPRSAGTATAYSLPESATLTKSTQSIDQVLVTPHRIGAFTPYTKQLLFTSSVDVEEFLRTDLLSVLNVKSDYLMLQGAGSQSEPTGLLNTTGVGSLTFGGTATWAEVLQFETSLANANADGVPNPRFGYITSPTVRNRWKQILKTGPGVSATLANSTNFIWEQTPAMAGSGSGIVNGAPADVTNQVLNNLVFYGNWRELVLCNFGQGIDMVIDQFSQATDGVVRVVLNSFIDIVVRHAASFCISSDSAAQ